MLDFFTCVFFEIFTCMNSPKISQVGIKVYAAFCKHLYIVMCIYIYMFACIYTKKIIGASNIPYDINQPTRVGVPSSSIFLCRAKSAKKCKNTNPNSKIPNAKC